MSNLCWLTDEQMARLWPHFLKGYGQPWADDRRYSPQGAQDSGKSLKGGDSPTYWAHQRGA